MTRSRRGQAIDAAVDGLAIPPVLPPAVSGPDSVPEMPPMLQLISRLALDPAVDVDKLERLLAMQERLEQRQAEAEYSAARARLAPKLPRIKKDGTIELPTKSGEVKRVKFSKWEDIHSAIQPALDEEKLWLSFPVIGKREGATTVTARVRHVNGFFEEVTTEGPLDTGPGRNNLQAYGSTLSYLKRYAACAILNIATEGEDDDGRAGGRQPISAEHAAEIDKLRRELGVPLESLLQLFETEKLMELSEQNFIPCMNLLRARQRREQKPGQEGKENEP